MGNSLCTWEKPDEKTKEEKVIREIIENFKDNRVKIKNFKIR